MLRRFVPTFAIRLFRKIFPQRSHRKQYATYEAALAECTEPGYDSEDVVNVVFEKTMRYRDEISSEGKPLHVSPTRAYSLCSLLATMPAPEIRVIDFGGACGADYYLARAVLPASIKLKWVVVETGEMVQKASAAFEDNELSFATDLTEAAKSLVSVDLLFTSGTLQCVNDPRQYLRTLVSVGANYILFNRLGLTKGPHDVITIHESFLSWNGPGAMPNGFHDRKIQYPFIFLKESAFHDALTEDYAIVMTFDDSSGIFPVNHEPIVGGGMLGRRKHNSEPPRQTR